MADGDPTIPDKEFQPPADKADKWWRPNAHPDSGKDSGDWIQNLNTDPSQPPANPFAPPPLEGDYIGLNPREEIIDKVKHSPAVREELENWLRVLKCGEPPSPKVIEDHTKSVEEQYHILGIPVPADLMGPEGFANLQNSVVGRNNLKIFEDVAKETGIEIACKPVSALPTPSAAHLASASLPSKS